MSAHDTESAGCSISPEPPVRIAVQRTTARHVGRTGAPPAAAAEPRLAVAFTELTHAV